MGITYRALRETKQGGDEIVIVSVIVVSGWTRGGGGSCSLWLLGVISLFPCWRLTSVWSQHIVLHHLCPSRFLCLRSL